MAELVLGDFQIILIREAVYYWDGGAVFGVVPKTLWSQKLPSDEWNRVPLALNCFLIRTGKHTVLIETGEGGKMNERMRERLKLPSVARPLREIIFQAGVDPDSIDIVINTHLHWDHCGWNTIVTGGVARSAFPRACYYTRRGEWEHAHQRHLRDSMSYIDSNYDPLVESGQMRLVDEDCEVAPGIRLHVAPGHTRDMMVVTAISAGQTFCFFSDLVPTAAHLSPSWVASFDLFPLESIDSKINWLGRAAKENWICGFGHDAQVDFARIAAIKNRFEVAENIKPALAGS